MTIATAITVFVRSGRQSDRVSHMLKPVHSSQKSLLPFFCSLKQEGYMTDFEKVTDFGNLYKAYKKAKSGKGIRKVPPSLKLKR